ncbi:hypothetical protein J7K27_09470 [Candidatus Bathyarchaeota archaeon]|nr:hypothetical protein [Candidatus Bathyarchaeota archaeon]
MHMKDVSGSLERIKNNDEVSARRYSDELEFLRKSAMVCQTWLLSVLGMFLGGLRGRGLACFQKNAGEDDRKDREDREDFGETIGGRPSAQQRNGRCKGVLQA